MGEDITVITLLLRWSVVVAMAVCAFIISRITKLIGNWQLSRIVKRIGVGIGLFALGRFIASIIDGYTGSSIGIVSNIVNWAFWAWVLWGLIKLNQTLKSEEIGGDGRDRISDSIAAIISEMRLEYHKLKTDA